MLSQETLTNYFKEIFMQHRHRFKAYVTATVIGTLLASTCLQARADGAGKAKPLELRRIMQDMGKNMQVITDGISREDWEMVVRAAPLIADHPQPPLAEKMRIMAFIGADMGRFKGYDEKTHQAAKVLEQAAMRGDGPAVISSFAALQNGCLACHQSFRKPFVDHFYGQR